MTLEYRCSNCGTVLMTSNADPVNDEIERLGAELNNQAAVIGALKTEDELLQAEDEEYGHALHAEQEAHDSNVIEIVRLQEVKRRALAIADERSKEACELRAENARLRAALTNFADPAHWSDRPGCLQWMGTCHAIDFAQSVLDHHEQNAPKDTQK